MGGIDLYDLIFVEEVFRTFGAEAGPLGIAHGNGAVINENLDDEVIVTVIATGFDDDKPATSVTGEEPKKSINMMDDEFDIPPFLRDRDNI